LVLPEDWLLAADPVCSNRLVKTRDRLIKHGQYNWLMLAKNRLALRLFGIMVRPTGALTLTSG
jgi:hypothetical protein